MNLTEMTNDDLEVVRGGLYETETSSDDGGGELVYVNGEPFLKTLRYSTSTGTWTWYYKPYGI